jgi:hypothetical protein
MDGTTVNIIDVDYVIYSNKKIKNVNEMREHGWNYCNYQSCCNFSLVYSNTN